MFKFITLYGIALCAVGIAALSVYGWHLTGSAWHLAGLLFLPIPVAMFVDIWRTK